MSIRVLIADDQSLVRAGFRLVLESHPDIEVVGEASNGNQATHGVGRLKPDVVLMDIRMPELDGIAATRQITARHPARVLILTTYDLDEYVYDALQAGASGFLLKDAPPTQLSCASHGAPSEVAHPQAPTSRSTALLGRPVARGFPHLPSRESHVLTTTPALRGWLRRQRGSGLDVRVRRRPRRRRAPRPTTTSPEPRLITSHHLLPLLLGDTGGLRVEVSEGTNGCNDAQHRIPLDYAWPRPSWTAWPSQATSGNRTA